MIKAAITGCHGSGKSTMIDRLRDHYIDEGYKILIVDEVARTCPHPLGTIKAQRYIWHEQYRREVDARATMNDIVICDRSLTDNLAYFRDILDHEPSRYGEETFSFFYGATREWMKTYDFVARLPLNEDYITNSDDILRSKDLDYARRIDKIFDTMIDEYINATVDDIFDFDMIFGGERI